MHPDELGIPLLPPGNEWARDATEWPGYVTAEPDRGLEGVVGVLRRVEGDYAYVTLLEQQWRDIALPLRLAMAIEYVPEDRRVVRAWPVVARSGDA